MGTPSFNKPETTHKSKNMKLIATLAAAATAQQLGAPVNPLMPAMPAMPALGGMGGMNPLMMMGGEGGMGQMNPLMLSMLLDDSVDMKALDKTKLEKVCSDAGVDCAADLAKIFNSIEGKQIDCAAAADVAVCEKPTNKDVAGVLGNP